MMIILKNFISRPLNGKDINANGNPANANRGIPHEGHPVTTVPAVKAPVV